MRIRKEDQKIINLFLSHEKMRLFNVDKNIEARSFVNKENNVFLIICDCLITECVAYLFTQMLEKKKFKLYLTLYNNKILLFMILGNDQSL